MSLFDRMEAAKRELDEATARREAAVVAATAAASALYSVTSEGEKKVEDLLSGRSDRSIRVFSRGDGSPNVLVAMENEGQYSLEIVAVEPLPEGL